MAKTKFPGFPRELVAFLNELDKHNNRSWFQANKHRYEEFLVQPALAYIEAMAGPLAKISPNIRVVPKRVGGSLMRIYRDVRFSKDKKPYKTNVGIQFRHVSGSDVHAPGFYLHIDPKEVFIGAGAWHPAPDALAKIRLAIDENPAAWRRAKGAKSFRENYELVGDSLKRPPRDYAADHPLLEDLKRKDHLGLCRLDHEDLFDPRIVEHTAAVFRAANSYMGFLCKALSVKFR